MICKSFKCKKSSLFCLSSVLQMFFLVYCVAVAVCLPRTIPPTLGFHLDEAGLSPHCPRDESGGGRALIPQSGTGCLVSQKGKPLLPSPQEDPNLAYISPITSPPSCTPTCLFLQNFLYSSLTFRILDPSNLCFCLGGD